MDKFAVTRPFVGTSYVDKETLIEILKDEIALIEQLDGTGHLCGRGISWYGISSEHKNTGEIFTPRHSINEFFDNLKEYHNREN